MLDSDSILQLERIPATMTVVGAGVIGIEYASVFAAIGVRVTVIERQARLLPFVDAEIIEALQYHLRELRVSLRFGETVVAVNRSEDGHILTQLASGKMIPSDAVLYAAGRQGATDALDLPSAGLEADKRGRITVNENYQTSKEHIYAVGDVVGFPSLASTSSEQGRLAACHAFGVPARSMATLLPFVLFYMLTLINRKRIMQEYTNNWWQNVVAYSTAVIMVALTAALVWNTLPTGGEPPQP